LISPVSMATSGQTVLDGSSLREARPDSAAVATHSGASAVLEPDAVTISSAGTAASAADSSSAAQAFASGTDANPLVWSTPEEGNALEADSVTISPEGAAANAAAILSSPTALDAALSEAAALGVDPALAVMALAAMSVDTDTGSGLSAVAAASASADASAISQGAASAVAASSEEDSGLSATALVAADADSALSVTAANENTPGEVPETPKEERQYQLVTEKTNHLLRTDDAADHIDPDGKMIGGNYEFPINHNDDSDAEFQHDLNLAMGEKNGSTGAHGGLMPPTHRTGFYNSLHHDHDALHVDRFDGAVFPVGTLLHSIVDVGIGHLKS